MPDSPSTATTIFAILVLILIIGFFFFGWGRSFTAGITDRTVVPPAEVDWGSGYEDVGS